jgi:hypothetical protein
MSFLSNKKLRSHWHKGVLKILIDLGATPVYYQHDGSLRNYELNTRAGILEVYPDQEYYVDGSANTFMSVCSRFKDVEAANRIFGNGRGIFAHHNPCSGKYNIHPSVAGDVKPSDRIPYIDKALDQVRRHFESVL